MSKLDRLSRMLPDLLAAAKRAKNMENIAKFGGGLIKVRTQLGSGVEKSGGVKKKLKRLKDSTIKRRRKNPRLDGLTTARRSNLTETGQLLKAIDGRSIGKGQGEIFFKPTRFSEKLTNPELAEYVSKARPFFHLSRSEQRQILNKVRLEFKRGIRSRLTKLK